MPLSTSSQHLSNSKSYNKHVVAPNINQREESPLVVIVGWTNSTSRHIAKYSEIYENAGCTTISVTVPFHRNMLFYRPLFEHDINVCIDALESNIGVNRNRSVFFHLFSGPGPMMFVNIMNYYYPFIEQSQGLSTFKRKKKEIIPNFGGVVFDSPFTEALNAKHLSEYFKTVPVTKALSQPTINTLAQLLCLYINYRYPMQRNLSELLKNLPNQLPQLILYSRMDPISSYKVINNYISHQRSKGGEVHGHMWEDSQHVLHLKKYPKEYLDLSYSFLNKYGN